MIDAMCSECVYFGSSLFSRRPGWRCGRDIKNQLEHDPTDQACGKFRRNGGLFLDGTTVPVLVVHKEGNSYDVEPVAECWRGKTIKVGIDMLVASDNYHVGVEEVDSIIRWETAVRQTEIVLSKKLASIEMVNIPIKTVRSVSECLVETVEDIFTLGFSISDIYDIVESANSKEIATMMLNPVAFLKESTIKDLVGKNSKGEDR